MLKSILGKPKQGSSPSLAEVVDNEPQQIEETLGAMEHIMNGDLDIASLELEKGNSPFHQLGKSTVAFMRGIMGLEQEVLKEVFEKLADTETQAYAQQKKVQKAKRTQSEIFPPGTEQALVIAEAQLMGAVVAVLSESLSESMKGFLKLRKAFVTLENIISAEKRYAQGTSPGSLTAQDSTASGTTTPSRPVSQASTQSSVPEAQMSELDLSNDKTPGAESDFEFFDTITPTEEHPVHAAYEGHLETSQTSKSSSATPSSADTPAIEVQPPPPALAEVTRRLSAVDGDTLLRDTSTMNAVDAFIHSGACLCFGMLLLMFSQIPPAFAPLLKIVGFRGDRQRGLALLWSATHLPNVNGAFAGLMLLSYYHNIQGFGDILPPVSHGGTPKDRCASLLADMRSHYPKSDLWRLLDAQMKASEHDIPGSLELTAAPVQGSFKQIEALRVFDRGLMQLFSHAYPGCAKDFVKCVGLNNWSHGVYFFIAGASEIAQYRKLRDEDPTEAMEHAAQAEEHFNQVPKLAGRKRLLARPMPFDVFVTRKVAKWQARAKERDCAFADAIGVSPVEEMIYFWAGFRRMGPEHMQKSIENLEDCEKMDGWKNEDADEKAACQILKSVALRGLGRVSEAKAILEETIKIDVSSLKGGNRENWTGPCVRYELAVCLWLEATGGSDNDSVETTEQRASALKRCSELLEEVSRWESYDLDTRIGLKVSTAKNALSVIYDE